MGCLPGGARRIASGALRRMTNLRRWLRFDNRAGRRGSLQCAPDRLSAGVSRVPGPRPRQELRAAPGRRRRLVRGPQGRAVWASGPERRREDDHDVDVVGPVGPRRGDHPVRRSRPGGPSARDQGPARRGPPGARALRQPHGAREPVVLGRAVPAGGEAAPGSGRPRPGAGRPDRPGGGSRQALLRRHEAASQSGARPGPLPEGGPHGRAHRRDRPAGAAEHPGGRAAGRALGDDGHLHDALSRGGGAVVRPDRDHGPREDPRGGNARRADPAGRGARDRHRPRGVRRRGRPRAACRAAGRPVRRLGKRSRRPVRRERRLRRGPARPRARRRPSSRGHLDPAPEPEHALLEPDGTRAARLMRLLLLLVAKDLRRKLRSPLGLIGALAFPVVFAGMIALAFGKDGGVPKVRMLVVDEDGSLLASGLASAFGSRQAASVFAGRTVSEAEGRELMENGKADALLTIPRGFGRDVLEARPVALRLVRNPSEGILPEIAEQTVGALADILDGGRRLLDRPMQTLRPLLDDRAAAPADADVAAVSLAFKRAIEGASKLVLPPAITLESDLFATSAGGSPSGGRASAKPSGSSLSAIFLAVFPGVAVYGLFMVADQGMRDVMTERTLGTLRRQLAGPVRAEAVIAAKAAYTAIVAAGALIVLALVVVAFVRASVSVPGFALLSSALVVAVTGTTSMV